MPISSTMYNRKATQDATKAPEGLELLSPLRLAKRGPNQSKGLTGGVKAKSTTLAELKETSLETKTEATYNPENPFLDKTLSTLTLDLSTTIKLPARAQSSPPGQGDFTYASVTKKGTKPITTFKGFFSMANKSSSSIGNKRKSQDITGGGLLTHSLTKKSMNNQQGDSTSPNKGLMYA